MRWGIQVGISDHLTFLPQFRNLPPQPALYIISQCLGLTSLHHHQHETFIYELTVNAYPGLRSTLAFPKGLKYNSHTLGILGVTIDRPLTTTPLLSPHALDLLQLSEDSESF